MSGPIQLRGDLAATWTSTNPTLASRELGVETDTLLYKIGDGSTAWTSLAYAPAAPVLATLMLDARTTEPSPPATGYLSLYAKVIAGRILPKTIGPSGLSTAMQPFLARNKIGYWCPQGNSNVVPGLLGYNTPTSTTGSIVYCSIYNTFTAMRRIGYHSTAVAGNVAYWRQPSAQITLGDGNGNGGFTKILRFGCSDNATVAGARMFMGISSSTSTPTNVEPSTLLNSIGIGNGAADTTMHLYYGGSVAQTPIDLGSNFPANTLSADPYELALFSPSNQVSNIYYEVTNIGSGYVATGSLNGGNGAGIILPTPQTLLAFAWGYRTNNAKALAVGFDIMSDYIETDN